MPAVLVSMAAVRPTAPFHEDAFLMRAPLLTGRETSNGIRMWGLPEPRPQQAAGSLNVVGWPQETKGQQRHQTSDELYQIKRSAGGASSAAAEMQPELTALEASVSIVTTCRSSDGLSNDRITMSRAVSVPMKMIESESVYIASGCRSNIASVSSRR